MERLEGRDLRTIVVKDGPLSPRRAAKCVSQACDALSEAHRLGIVHRDMKPSNLFVAQRDRGGRILKVLDFGVARFESPGVSGDGAVLTAEAELVGSPSYMAPEQLLDARSVNARADIWSLGALLYFLVTGQKPWTGDNLKDLVLDILTGAPRPLLEVRPDLPRELADIVHRCLEKDPERRYASAVELSLALAPFTCPASGREVIQLPLWNDELTVDLSVISAA
jgi:serine/threonine-protein kinase